MEEMAQAVELVLTLVLVAAVPAIWILMLLM